jgi:hypothetical protein
MAAAEPLVTSDLSLRDLALEPARLLPRRVPSFSAAASPIAVLRIRSVGVKDDGGGDYARGRGHSRRGGFLGARGLSERGSSRQLKR